MTKTSLFGKTLDELKEVAASLGLQKFVASQIADWLYKKDISSIDEMLNLSKKSRELLNEKYELGLRKPAKVQESMDGTKKYLFVTDEMKYIEAAYIPDKDRATLCVSSQVGCKMGCVFCMTGKQGFQGQLTAGQIVNQIHSLPEREKLTNVVYMGMGEPFDNLDEVLKSIEILTSEWGYAWSPRRITVSTIGIVPAMKTFLDNSEAHLAVSLHSPFESERKSLMPIGKVYSLSDILKIIRDFDWGRQRRISFEYIMFKGVNDTSSHVRELVKLLGGMRTRLNLIRFHPIPDTPLEGTAEKRLMAFKDELNEKGVFTTIRASRGQDILAACGLLSTLGEKDQVIK
ncbi:MAG: 23S rRNA (adenine(2503)-C(2))-methyltransferase RlmN [Bacteroidota bacterium]|nr:23S rRNA (adenine(2503)-C(2))-methyltransferase RlmN [Bacteroidota bacterium]